MAMLRQQEDNDCNDDDIGGGEDCVDYGVDDGKMWQLLFTKSISHWTWFIEIFLSEWQLF